VRHIAVSLLALSFLFASVCLSTPPAAADVVAALEQHYNRLRSLQAEFVQRYTLGQTTRVESGRVYFQKPDKMRWEYESPEEKLFLCDGTYVYLYVPAERQVSRSRLHAAGDWRVPFGLLLGRVNLFELFSRIEIKPIERAGQPRLTQLRGLPKSAQQGFSEVWLDVNASQQLQRVELRGPDGSIMEFHFRRWGENPHLAPELFRLHVPPDTVWIDEAEISP